MPAGRGGPDPGTDQSASPLVLTPWRETSVPISAECFHSDSIDVLPAVSRSGSARLLLGYVLLVQRATGAGRRKASSSPKAHDDGGRSLPLTDFDPAAKKRGGRSFGAALSEVEMQRLLTSSAGLDRPNHVTLPQQGLAGSGASGSSLVLVLCPYVGSDRWWLNRLAPLRCLGAPYTRSGKTQRSPLRASPPIALTLAVRSNPSQAVRNRLAGHA